MRIKYIIISMLVCCTLAAWAQPTQQQPEWEWYLDEVVGDLFVGRNYFEYYYMPSAADMRQQREKGEVTYFLNTPEGLNSKKVRDMIDRLMASYDDIKAVGDWHVTTTTYWKEYRYEKNKFRFSVKRKALDDGTYYVSVTETADYFKSLGKKKSQKSEIGSRSSTDQPTVRSSKRDRKPVVLDDNEVDRSEEDIAVDLAGEEDHQQQAPSVSAKEQRRLERERREAEKRELKAKQRREQEERREKARAQKEAEKMKKAEEKKKRQEEERLKKEEKQREQELKREQQRKEREAREQLAAKKRDSRYHYTDVALWLSEKYDFTQTAMGDNSCTMFSTMVKDVEMAKLAIKNALKGSEARMAVPWRVNSETQAVETGYMVDGHVLVFAIGKDADGQINLSITEVSDEQFELFKQSLNGL